MGEAEVDFGALRDQIKKLVDDLGVTKDELQTIFDGGAAGAAAEKKKKKAMDSVDKLVAALRKVVASTPISDVERDRKIADLEGEIESLKIIVSLSPDFQERMTARDEIARRRQPPGPLAPVAMPALAELPPLQRAAATLAVAPPQINVTIGRVEIRAVTPVGRPGPAPHGSAPRVSLDAYLDGKPANGR
jgi:hypothetical protein